MDSMAVVRYVQDGFAECNFLHLVLQAKNLLHDRDATLHHIMHEKNLLADCLAKFGARTASFREILPQDVAIVSSLRGLLHLDKQGTPSLRR